MKPSSSTTLETENATLLKGLQASNLSSAKQTNFLIRPGVVKDQNFVFNGLLCQQNSE